MSAEPPPISASQPLAPPALDRVIKKCLAKDPDERWQTAHDLKDEIVWLGEAVLDRQRPNSGRQRSLFAWKAVSLGLSLGIILLALLYLRPASPDGREPLRLSILPPQGGRFSAPTASPPAIAPDGRSVAFVALSEARYTLWLRRLDSMEALSLPGTDGAYQPFWSPDSRGIGFFADGKLKVIDTRGGFPRTVCDVGENVRGGTWNRHGDIVFAGGDVLQRVSETGGTPVAVTALNRARGENSHRWPSFLPDGQHFLYTVRSDHPEHHGIYVGALDSASTTRLLNDLARALWAASGHVLFVRDGTLFAQRLDLRSLALRGEPLPVATEVAYNFAVASADFAVSENRVLLYRHSGNLRQVVWLNRAGTRVGTVAEPGFGLRSLVLSPDERRLALEHADPLAGSTDVWTVDLETGARLRLTSHPAWDSAPLWSPDGRRILFHSPRDQARALYEIGSEAPGEGQIVLKVPPNTRLCDWARDGRFVVYETSTPRTKSDLWVLPMSGKRTPFAYLQTPADEQCGQISPDGRLLAYSSDDSGRAEVYVGSFPSPGNRRQISTTDGRGPRWRRDGAELFYLSFDGMLMVVPVSAIESRRGARAQPLFRHPLPEAVRSLAFYDVSLDGQRFIVFAGSEDAETLALTVVLHWTAGPKQ